MLYTVNIPFLFTHTIARHNNSFLLHILSQKFFDQSFVLSLDVLLNCYSRQKHVSLLVAAASYQLNVQPTIMILIPFFCFFAVLCDVDVSCFLRFLSRFV